MDLVMNRADFEWWSFHEINLPNVYGCGDLTGPMAIVISEETPPRKITKTFYVISILIRGLTVFLSYNY